MMHAGVAIKGQAIVVNVPFTNAGQLLEYFGLGEKDIPTLIVLNQDVGEGENPKKYRYAGSILDSDAVLAYLSEVLNGEVEETLKSEQATPEDTKHDVIVVRGSTFKGKAANT